MSLGACLKTQSEGLSLHYRICPGSSFPQVFGGISGSCKHPGPPPEACGGDGWREFLDTLLESSSRVFSIDSHHRDSTTGCHALHLQSCFAKADQSYSLGYPAD
jgi:hypothetical protein